MDKEILKTKIEEHLRTTTATKRFHSMMKCDFWDEIMEATAFLGKVPVSQRIWHVRNDLYKDNPGCALCGKDVLYDNNLSKYLTCCSRKCHRNYNMERIAKTNMERYGGVAPACSSKTRAKMQATTMERHGVDNISKSEKMKQHKMEKAFEKYGVDNVSRAPEVRAKISAFKQNLTDNEVRDIMIKQEKSAKQGFRKYEMPDGRIVNIQGYEHWAIEKLLESHNSEQIKVAKGNVPIIKYHDVDGKMRRHFPDIYIPDCNLIVEVKSTFTYQKALDINLCKKEAAIARGFNYQIWVYDHKGQLIIDP